MQRSPEPVLCPRLWIQRASPSAHPSTACSSPVTFSGVSFDEADTHWAQRDWQHPDTRARYRGGLSLSCACASSSPWPAVHLSSADDKPRNQHSSSLGTRSAFIDLRIALSGYPLQSCGYSSLILLTNTFSSSSQRLKYRPASSKRFCVGVSSSTVMFSSAT